MAYLTLKIYAKFSMNLMNLMNFKKYKVARKSGKMSVQEPVNRKTDLQTLFFNIVHNAWEKTVLLYVIGVPSLA